MVSFRTLLTAAVALAAPISAAITPAEVVQNLKTLTTKSQALQAPAQSITIINGPLILIGQGPFPVCTGSLPASTILGCRVEICTLDAATRDSARSCSPGLPPHAQKIYL